MTTKSTEDDPLEALSKKELLVRAHALGIDGAESFTKLELVDEIRRHQSSDRGLLGKARDLLRNVVEKGIAKVVSGASPKEAEEAVPPAPVASIPSAELAGAYLAQGDLSRAKEIARAVVESDPSNVAARAIAEQPEGEGAEDLRYSMHAIEPEAFVVPPSEPPVSVPPMLDDAPFPERYDCDECVALAVDPTTLYVYWESRLRTIERAHRAFQRGGEEGVPSSSPTSTLRVLVVQPGDSAPLVTNRDFEIVDLSFGEYFVRDLPEGAIVRAAIGIGDGERFIPLAHTLDVEPPVARPAAPLARDLAVWTEGATYEATALPEELARTLPLQLGGPPELTRIHREGFAYADADGEGAEVDADDEGDEDWSATWRLGLSSAALQGLRARRRKRRAARASAGAPPPTMPGVPRKAGASDRLQGGKRR